MSWMLFAIAQSKRGELDGALQDDVLSRQSRKIREASLFGGAGGEWYVLVEGSDSAVERAGTLLSPIGRRVVGEEAERIYGLLREEEDAASAGMGLFFTD